MSPFRLLAAAALALVAFAALASATSNYYACTEGFNQYKWCDTRLSIPDRVSALLKELTLEEKANQMGDVAKGVPRLGLPEYHWWTEALHGLNTNCYQSPTGTTKCPTSYPAGINMAASFNMDLVNEIGKAISDEVRAGFNLKMKAYNGPVAPDVWTPDINIFRDPRWGRGQETPGEDPFLSGRYAVAMISGLQETVDPKYWKVAATAKHLACYSLEVYGGVNRVAFDANVTTQDLQQTFYPAFEAAVREGHAHGIMCSYNAINGVPSCANKPMLTDLLRNTWGFDGYVTGDCFALAAEVDGHHYLKTGPEAAAASIKAGTDLDCVTNGWYDLNVTVSSIYADHLQEAVKQGLVTEAEIDVNLARLYSVQMHFGLFDPQAMLPYESLDATTLDSVEHRLLARDMGRQSIILLKNEDKLLPLASNTATPLKVALIGPHHASTTDLCSNYFGGLPSVVSIKAAFQTVTGVSLTFAAGCKITGADQSGFAEAVQNAKAADVAVLVVGINGQIEGEELDRYDITLPGVQNQLIAAVLAAQPKTIIVIVNGGMVGMETIVGAPAIVEALYPGEEGGRAIVDVLMGRYNPSGRLPYTIYPSTFTNESSFFNFDVRRAPGLTYRFYQKKPVFEFGHGLSYTTFAYSNAAAVAQSVPADVNATTTFSVTVKNTGAMDGHVSVLGFVSLTTPKTAVATKAPYVHPACPLKQLFGFQKVFLAVGDSTTLTFSLSPAAAFCVDEQGNKVAIAGTYNVTLGDATFTLTVGADPVAPAKSSSSSWSSGATIGVCVGGAILLLGVLFFFNSKRLAASTPNKKPTPLPVETQQQQQQQQQQAATTTAAPAV